MNKFVSLIIAFIILLSSFASVVFASDYSGHWAESYINTLIADGIITGDSNGIRPDDNVKRSEFIRIINNAFRIEGSGTVNFPDVLPDKWYFNEFLKAKSAGYLNGDNDGNANPEKEITRIEAAVILQRVLLLNQKETSMKFSDDESIAEWGKAAVYTLVSNGIISGYTDGNFKPLYTLTRAEAFALLCKSKKVGHSELTQPSVSVGNSTVSSSGGSGGGGGFSGGTGGSGGGGSSSSSSPEFKFERINTETDTLYWNTLPGVTYYSLEVKRTTEGKNEKSISETLNSNFKDITELLKSASDVARIPNETFVVKVSCVFEGKSYYATTEYKVVFPHIEQPTLTSVTEIISDVEKIYIEWENNNYVSSWILKVNFDGSGLSELPYTISEGKCRALVPETYYAELNHKYPFEIEAVADINNPDIINMEKLSGDIDMPLYFSGKGTSVSPYIIKNARHFNNIRYNASAIYTIAEDITLPASYVPFELKGTVAGADSQSYKNITVDIVNNDSSSNYTGLFTTINGGSVKYLNLEGSVKGASKHTGGFCGEILLGNISYVENHASVTGSGENTAGIAGYATNGDFISYVTNYGKIIGNKNAGGITTRTYGISYARNIGDVSAVDYAGGIAQFLTSHLTACYNKGTITAEKYASGIAPLLGGTNKTVTACYNTGKIINTATGVGYYASGVFGFNQGGFTVSSCYNVGELISSNGEFYPIYVPFTPTSETNFMIVSDVYYLSENAQDDNLPNTNPLTSSALADTEMVSELFVKGSGEYKYPQLAALPDVVKPVYLETPQIQVIVSRSKTELKIYGDSNTLNYKVIIYGDSECTENLYETSLSGGLSQSVDIADKLNEYKTYYIYVKALGNNVTVFDSEFVSLPHVKTAFKLEAPVLTAEPESNGDISNEVYTFSWKLPYEGSDLTDITENVLDSYTVKIIDSDSNEVINETISKNSSSYSIFNLVLGNEYTVKITADSENAEECSEPLEFSFSTLYASGKGTSEEPYILKNNRHFRNIELNLNAYYNLENDLILDQSSDVSDANYYSLINNFAGKLIGTDADGNEAIRTVTVNGTKAGIFDTVGNGTVIKNIKATGNLSFNYTAVTVNTTVQYAPFVSVIAEGSTVLFENCESNVSIESEITTSNNSKRYIILAGFVESVYKTSSVAFKKCKNTGNADLSAQYVYYGGFINNSNLSNGGNVAVNFDECVNFGNINADVTGNTYIGGYISASTKTTVSVTNSDNSGDITVSGTPGTLWIGGFIGFQNGNGKKVTMNECTNAGRISGGKKTGGLIGWASLVEMTNCHNTENIAGLDYVGGLVGYCDDSGLTINNSTNTGELTSSSGNKGNLCGYPVTP